MNQNQPPIGIVAEKMIKKVAETNRVALSIKDRLEGHSPEVSGAIIGQLVAGWVMGQPEEYRAYMANELTLVISTIIEGIAQQQQNQH